MGNFEQTITLLKSLPKCSANNNNQYNACCPAHNDNNPSLSFKIDHKRILIHCHAGCSIDQICNSLDITLRDLFKSSGEEYNEVIKTVSKNKYLSDLENQISNPFAKFLTNQAFCPLRHQYKWNIGFDSYGNTIYYQVDQHNRVINGQKFRYDESGHRVKSKNVYPIITKNERGKQIFYGIWQLSNGDNKPIALVESEKTALIMSFWMAQFSWIAKCGATKLTIERAKPLSGRTVNIFVDADEKGRNSAIKDSKILKSLNCKVQIIDHFPYRNDGYDMADWFIDLHQDWPDSYQKRYLVGEAYEEFL